MRPSTRTAVTSAALAVVFALGVFVGSGVRSGGAASAATKCSESTLDGSYGIRFDGFSTSLGRFSSVSLWSFDGKGRLSASETFSSEKQGPGRREVAGSYRVYPDCSFSLLFPSELAKEHEAVGSCVVVDGGKEFYCLDVEEGWVATGVGKAI